MVLLKKVAIRMPVGQLPALLLFLLQGIMPHDKMRERDGGMIIGRRSERTETDVGVKCDSSCI